jgi:hypothetical protein
MMARKVPVTQAEKDYCSHVLFALSDCGAMGSGLWAEMVEHAMRSLARGHTVHACVMKWLLSHPVEMQRAFTEVQHEGEGVKP